MRTYNYELISSTGVGNDISTSAIGIDYTIGYAIQAIYTGGVNGVIRLQASNDNINFDTVTGSPRTIATVTEGSTGSVIWNCRWAGYPWVKAQFLASSSIPSTGSIAFIINSKGA